MPLSKPAAKKKRRRRSNNRGAPLAPVVTAGNRRTTFYRQYTFQKEINISDSGINPVRLSLNDILTKSDGKDVMDWFDEYRIKRVNIELINLAADDLNDGPFNVYCVPDVNPSTIPNKLSAMYNMTGLRLYTFSISNIRSMTLGTVRPTFDVTGSLNHFTNDWLDVGRSRDTVHNCFLMSVKTPAASPVTVSVIMRCWVAFRGFQ